MPPPDLSTDAPIIDVLKPLIKGIDPVARIEFKVLLFCAFQGFFCHGIHVNEPLQSQFWLNDCP